MIGMEASHPQVHFIPATGISAALITPLLRNCDRAEISATLAMPEQEAIARSIENSTEPLEAWHGMELVCLFGIGQSRLRPGYGSPWMVGTDAIYKHDQLFLRMSRAWIEAVHPQYQLLENWVFSENRDAMRWLDWLGFEINPQAQPYGQFGKPFHHFEMRGGAH